MQQSMSVVTEAVERAVAALDIDRLQREYWDQNEFLIIKQFLPRAFVEETLDRKSTRLNSSHSRASRMPSSA